MSRDSNRFKLDPTIVALNSQTAGQNYGHVISQAFKDLGDIENNKINLQLTDTKNQYEEIKLNSIKDELDDDRTYKNYILAEDKEDFLKNNTFKTSKHTLMAENYKNTLSLKEQQEHTNRAFANFTDEKGNLNRTGAFEHLYSKYKDGTIKENELYGIMDAIDQKNKSGIYKPKLTMQEQLDMMKTQAEIKKINSDTNKNYHSMQSENKDFYGPYGISKDDPLKKEKITFITLQNAGKIPLEQKFENWFAETGGKTNLDAKIENTSKAKNDLRIQLTSLDNLKDLLIDKYDPTVAGAFDGPIQAIQEKTGMNSTLSAAYESNMSRAKMELTKALAGGNASNRDASRVDAILGSSGFNTEAGLSSKYKEAMHQSIIAINQTLNQLERAGEDVTEQKENLGKYINLMNDLQDWKGGITTQEYLEKKQKQQKQQINQNGTKLLRSQNQTNQPTQQNTNQPSWRDYE